MVINKHFSVFIWLLSLPPLMSDQVKVDVLLHFSLLKTIAMDSNATKYINLSQNLNSNWFQVNFSAKNDDFYIENDQSLLVDPFNEPWKKILGTVSYVLQVLGGLVLMAFIKYESQGNLAQFRTALNQLTSWIGVNVSRIMDIINTYQCSLRAASKHPPASLGFPYRPIDTGHFFHTSLT